MPRFDLNARWIDYVIATVALLIFGLALVSGLPRIGGDNSIRIVAALLPPQLNAYGSGREAEIIRAALRAGGVTRPVEFHVVPFTRHWQMYDSDPRFDAVATTPPEVPLSGSRSAPYIAYQNGVIYRVQDFPDGLGARPLESLAGRRVVAFAGASAILPEMREVGREALIYLERPDQVSHSIMFTNDVVDVVVADHLIFTHYTREVLGENYVALARGTRFDPVFCPTPYQMVFRDNALRDQFDRGLEILRLNGELDAINARYNEQAGVVEVPRVREGCET
jgi:polar amino acid transport system substrate-binding protein